MVVELEHARNLADKVALYEQANEELEKQIALLERIVSLKDRQIQVLEDTTKRYEKLVETQSALYEKELAASRPSIGRRIMEIVGLIGVGVLIGILL